MLISYCADNRYINQLESRASQSKMSSPFKYKYSSAGLILFIFSKKTSEGFPTYFYFPIDFHALLLFLIVIATEV